jgi:ABC-type sugar transport system substrate-binding protein
VKKTLAIILALCMAAAIFACGDKAPPTDGGSPPPNESSPGAPPVSSTPSAPPPETSVPLSEEDTGADPLDKVGFYDPDYDYSANKRYKVAYLTMGLSVFASDFDKAFEHWAEKANVEYTGVISVADNDAYLTQIPALKNQGYDGILCDPDMMIYSSIAQRCAEVGLEWMGCMGQAAQFSDDMTSASSLHPYVGFDHYSYGVAMVDKLVSYWNETWPDADISNVALLGLDMAISPPLHDRMTGAEARFNELFPGHENQVFIMDTSSGMMDTNTANDLATSAISSNMQYDYWIVAAAIDDFAQGAALAFDNLGMTDNGCIATIGGTALRAQWDAGQQDAWRFAYTTPNTKYGEPLFFALYAFMSGQATPETIWPSWKNNSSFYGNEYAELLLPSYWMEYNSYKQLLAWADVYADSNTYGYDKTGIARDMYPAREAVPDYYKA